MHRAGTYHKTLGLYYHEELIGYGQVNPENGRLGQIAIHPQYRGRGLGRFLLNQLGNLGNRALSIINIDEQHKETNAFFKYMGFERFIGQYEMQMKI